MILSLWYRQCGGVACDLNGRIDVQRLYAIGETACTGFHGANRLASNSLLEALVYPHRAFKASVDAFHAIGNKITVTLNQWDEADTTDSDEAIVVSHNRNEIRRLMWSYVDIIRSDKRLQRTLRQIENIQEEIIEKILLILFFCSNKQRHNTETHLLVPYMLKSF